VTPPSSAKQALTDSVLEHLLTYGRLDESLRSIARAIGAGHSLLLYHFGSRDELLAAVHLACEQRQRRHLTELRPQTSDPLEIMRMMWANLADQRMWPLYRLGFSLRASGIDLTGQQDDREQWIATLTPLAHAVGQRGEQAADEAMLWLAACRGLLWELVTGADPSAVDRAAERLFSHYASRRQGSASAK